MAHEIQLSLGQLETALERLRRALSEPRTNPLGPDRTIQRFEFTIELSWKVMKRRLEVDGIPTATPRGACPRPPERAVIRCGH